MHAAEELLPCQGIPCCESTHTHTHNFSGSFHDVSLLLSAVECHSFAVVIRVTKLRLMPLMRSRIPQESNNVTESSEEASDMRALPNLCTGILNNSVSILALLRPPQVFKMQREGVYVWAFVEVMSLVCVVTRMKRMRVFLRRIAFCPLEKMTRSRHELLWILTGASNVRGFSLSWMTSLV